jgi:hypothetical protein
VLKPSRGGTILDPLVLSVRAPPSSRRLAMIGVQRPVCSVDILEFTRHGFVQVKSLAEDGVTAGSAA